VPAKRRVFTEGEIIGNGWTVLSSERVAMPLADGSVHPKTLGIRVRCHCGNPFVVSITNLSSQLGCGCSSKNKGSNSPERRAKRNRATLKKEMGLAYYRPIVNEFKLQLRMDAGISTEIAIRASRLIAGGRTLPDEDVNIDR
jgi:hypothetical protein